MRRTAPSGSMLTVACLGSPGGKKVYHEDRMITLLHCSEKSTSVSYEQVRGEAGTDFMHLHEYTKPLCLS